MLARSCLKSCELGFSITRTKNFQTSKLRLETAEEIEIKLLTFARSQRKQGDSRKNIYLCFTDYTKTFDCVDHYKLWEALREMGIPDHLTSLLRNLYVGQEATVRIRHGTTDQCQIEKGVVHQGCMLSPCLLNLYAQYITWNAWLEESQVGIKIAERNINNLRYANVTTLMAEIEEELKNLLMHVKGESENTGLKLNIKNLRLWHSFPSLHGKSKRKKQKQWQILFSWAPKSLLMVTAAMKLKDAYFLEGKLWQS